MIKWQNKQAVAMTGTSIGCQKSLKNFKKSIDKARKMWYYKQAVDKTEFVH